MSRFKFIRQGLLAGVFALAGVTAFAAENERLIITCGADCAAVAANVTALGGTVNRQFKYSDAIAVTTDKAQRQAVMSIAGVARVQKDLIVAAPEPAIKVDLEVAAGTSAVTGAELAAAIGNEPAGYLFNNDLTGASAMFGAGYAGDGVIVAVIDTGTANVPGFPVGNDRTIAAGFGHGPGFDQGDTEALLEHRVVAWIDPRAEGELDLA